MKIFDTKELRGSPAVKKNSISRDGSGDERNGRQRKLVRLEGITVTYFFNAYKYENQPKNDVSASIITEQLFGKSNFPSTEPLW